MLLLCSVGMFSLENTVTIEYRTPSHRYPIEATLPVSSYRIFSLNYTPHVIICETYLYAMYRSHKRAIASESNDPLGFTRVIFYTHNTARVAIFKQPKPQNSRRHTSLLPLWLHIRYSSAIFFYHHGFLNKVVNHTWGIRKDCLLFPMVSQMFSF